MNLNQINFLYTLLLYKFNSVYDYRKFLVKNFGIDDVEHSLDSVKMSIFCVSSGEKTSAVETITGLEIINYFLGTPYVYSLNNFIEIDKFKDIFLIDIV